MANVTGKAAKGKKTVHLPLLEGSDQVIEIGINGTMYILKRGEDAQVSEGVYEVLRNAGLVEGEEK